jgi:hypothetical protein
MDKDGNVANWIRVEVMELKPVEIQKASKERARGEGQTPFSKMVKWDNFVYIFHRKRFAKRGVPVDKTFLLKQTLGNKIHEFVVGALTVCPLSRWRLRLLPLPILLVGSLGRHFQICLPWAARGVRRKGWRDLASLGFSKWVKVERGSDWGFGNFLADWRLEARILPGVTAGLNNQWPVIGLLFQSWRVISGDIPKMRGRLVDFLDKIFD